MDDTPSTIDAAVNLGRVQLYALLLRLSIFRDRHQVPTGANAQTLQRFKHFQRGVEENFARTHQVADYARQLGCTVKSLTRSTLKAAGITAKVFITSRIILEAKRLLTHSDLTVTLIGESLGFEEATNFIKFFKRETGCTPAEFRRQQEAIGN